MNETGNPKYLNWFGNRRPVRLLILCALLALGVVHFSDLWEFLCVLWGKAQPMVLGGCLAYVLDVVVKQLEKIWFPKTRKQWLNRSRRTVCILLSVVIVLALLCLIIFSVIPGLIEALTLLATEVPRYVEILREWLLGMTEPFATIHQTIASFTVDWKALQEELIFYARSGWGGILSSTVSVIGTVTGSVGSFFLSMIFALFLLTGKERLHRQWNRLTLAVLGDKRVSGFRKVMSTVNRCFSGFIVGQGLNALLLGALTTLMMLICGMPYAVIVGIINGTMGLIPVIGGYIGVVLGAFLVFTVSPAQALLFLILIIILQTVLGNAVYPRLVGNSIGLPGVWVLFAVAVGGGLAGVGGMLIGVPLAAALYDLCRSWVEAREKGKEPENG